MRSNASVLTLLKSLRSLPLYHWKPLTFDDCAPNLIRYFHRRIGSPSPGFPLAEVASHPREADADTPLEEVLPCFSNNRKEHGSCR